MAAAPRAAVDLGGLQSLDAPEFRENTERFQIRGRISETGEIDTVDLLRDQLIATKQILRVGDKSRAVQPESAFDAIEVSYKELHSELMLAAGLSE